MTAAAKTPLAKKIIINVSEKPACDGKKAEVDYSWTLKSSKGHILGQSHVTFKKKSALAKNLINVFGPDILSSGRLTVRNAEIHELILVELFKTV